MPSASFLPCPGPLRAGCAFANARSRVEIEELELPGLDGDLDLRARLRARARIEASDERRAPLGGRRLEVLHHGLVSLDRLDHLVGSGRLRLDLDVSEHLGARSEERRVGK